MKKLFIILFSVISLTAFAQPQKVAVYVIGEDANVNKVLGSKLVAAIARSVEYSAIERTESFLVELSKEHNYQRSGAVDDNEISRLGRQFGVQYVCVAAITEVFNEKYLSARLIDVETAQVERTASSSGSLQSLNDIVVAAENISSDLLSFGNDKTVKNAKKVAVYVVRNDADKDIEQVIGDMIVQGFTWSERYIAIERTNSFLTQISKEHNYQRTGAVDDNEISRLGRQFGVQYVCVADVSDVFGEKYISARLIDVETAEIANTSEAGGEMNTMEQCREIASKIASDLSDVTLQERKEIERHLQENIYVNLGLPSGTLWKIRPDEALCSYRDALQRYGSHLPTKAQCQELIDHCKFEQVFTTESDEMTLTIVTGPNGNKIYLPAYGKTFVKSRQNIGGGCCFHILADGVNYYDCVVSKSGRLCSWSRQEYTMTADNFSIETDVLISVLLVK